MPALPISPKRKRPTKEPHTGPFPSRLKTSHLSPTHTHPDAQLRTDIKNPSSPRTTVAGRLQTLDLDANPELTPLAFSHSNLPCGENGVHAFTAATTSVTLPRREKEAEVLEVPETPRLKPVLLDEEREGGGVEMEAGLEKLWWSEGEITGHDPDPKDPADDGEGINGVGFLPTPAQSYARSLRRKRQVKDWKEREAREARQKRSDRRRRQVDIPDLACSSTMNTVDHDGVNTARKVRFLEA